MIVVTAQRGGTFRETIAMAKAYAEARQQHGESELLDEIVSAKPERDHTHYHSTEELKQEGLQHLRESVEVLERKATPVEVDEYRQFIVNLTHKVAAAHREHGQDVSEPEQAAIDDITAALNPTAGQEVFSAVSPSRRLRARAERAGPRRRRDVGSDQQFGHKWRPTRSEPTPPPAGPTNATMAAPVVLLTSSLLSARDRSTANK